VNPIQAPNGSWSFHDGKHTTHVKLNSVISITNYLALKQIVVDGVGIGVLPSFCVREELENGTLVQVLPDETCSPGVVTAVYPHFEHVPTKVKKFTAFLRKRFAGHFSVRSAAPV